MGFTGTIVCPFPALPELSEQQLLRACQWSSVFSCMTEMISLMNQDTLVMSVTLCLTVCCIQNELFSFSVICVHNKSFKISLICIYFSPLLFIQCVIHLLCIDKLLTPTFPHLSPSMLSLSRLPSMRLFQPILMAPLHYLHQGYFQTLSIMQIRTASK